MDEEVKKEIEALKARISKLEKEMNKIKKMVLEALETSAMM